MSARAVRVDSVVGEACQVLDCMVIDCESRVKRVLTRSVGTDFDIGFFLFGAARRDVEGEEKSCRLPLSISHVPPLIC